MSNRPPLISMHPGKASEKQQNLSPPARVLSAASGLGLIANGLRQGGIRGCVQILLGAAATWRGYRGVCPLKSRLAPTAFEQHLKQDEGWSNGKAVTRSVTVQVPRSQAFEFFRQPQNLGGLIPWVDRIEQLDPVTSQWSAQGPLDRTLQWTLTQRELEAGAKLQWNTLYQGPWKHEITAWFTDAPRARGTEIKVVLACEPYPGTAAQAVASAISKFTDRALLNLLRRAKQQLETGEVATNAMTTDSSSALLYVHEATGEDLPEGVDPTLTSTTTGGPH